MNKDLYSLLETKKLTSSRQIIEFCNKSSFDEVAELIAECFGITNAPKEKLIPSLFNFSASLTLSGGEFPCSFPAHRLERIAEIAQFSALFADSVRIHNPFDFIYIFTHSDKDDFSDFEEQKFRTDSLVALETVRVLKPLIESGIAYFSRTIYFACKSCLKAKERAAKQLGDQMYADAKKKVDKFIKEKISIEIPNENEIHLIGTKEIIGEDLVYSSEKSLKILKNKHGEIIKKPNTKLWKCITSQFINEAIDSVMYQKIETLENFSETYLTSNAIEKLLLTQIGKKSNNISDLVVNNVPIASGIGLNRVLEIRNTYQDSFNKFRSFLEELSSKSGNFENQSEFNTWVSGKIKNELEELRHVQNEGRRKLFGKGLVAGGFLGATLAISKVNNFDIQSVLGVMQSMMGCSDVFRESSEFESKLGNNPSYFYFKLTEGSKN